MKMYILESRGSRKNILYEVCKKNDGGTMAKNYNLFLLNILMRKVRIF